MRKKKREGVKKMLLSFEIVMSSRVMDLLDCKDGILVHVNVRQVQVQKYQNKKTQKTQARSLLCF